MKGRQFWQVVLQSIPRSVNCAFQTPMKMIIIPAPKVDGLQSYLLCLACNVQAGETTVTFQHHNRCFCTLIVRWVLARGATSKLWIFPVVITLLAGCREMSQPLHLQTPFCMLDCVILRNTRLNNDALICLANALTNNGRLRELDLRGNPDAMAAGWVAFSSVLQNPYSSLVERTTLCSHMNIRIMISFVQALANNNKLSELLLEAWSYAYISTEVNAAFIRVLCNSSSILNTFSSNHTIGKLCCNIEDRYLSEDIRSLL